MRTRSSGLPLSLISPVPYLGSAESISTLQAIPLVGRINISGRAGMRGGKEISTFTRIFRSSFFLSMRFSLLRKE
jgi:hypothetical protein